MATPGYASRAVYLHGYVWLVVIASRKKVVYARLAVVGMAIVMSDNVGTN